MPRTRDPCGVSGTWVALSKAVGKDRNQLRRLQNKHPESFPPGPPFNTGDVRLWLARNVNSRRPIRGLQKQKAEDLREKTAAAIADSGSHSGIESDLLSGDPLLIARASAKAAGVQYAACVRAGALDRGSVEILKKSLEELRHCEKSWMDLAVRRRELIERDTAAEVAGHLAQRAVQVLADVETRLVQQVELWCADAKFRKLPTEKRGLKVRDWFDGLARAARVTEAEAMDGLIREIGEES